MSEHPVPGTAASKSGATIECLPLPDAAATERLGAGLAAAWAGGTTVIALDGPLGAGKTTLARGLLRALGHAGRVRSPSYSLLERYDLGPRSVLHLDLYRISDPAELEYLGLRESLVGDVLVLVEWPARGGGALPAPDLELRLDYAGAGRNAAVIPYSDSGARLAAALASFGGS